jgi:hypothetical protein
MAENAADEATFGDVLLRGHHAFSEPRQRCADISCERLRAWT